MSKEHKPRREDKKKPQLTPKEKRAAKRMKKSDTATPIGDLKH